MVLRGRRSAARNCKLIKKGRDLFRAHLSWMLAAVEADKFPNPVQVRLFSARGVMQAPDRGAYGFNEGHVDRPGCPRAVCRARVGTYRCEAGASCGDQTIVRPGFGRPGYRCIGTNLASRDAGGVHGLATGIRAYAAAAYLRRCADRSRKSRSIHGNTQICRGRSRPSSGNTEMGCGGSRPTCGNPPLGLAPQLIATLGGGHRANATTGGD
jgi:hypothetical protein